MSRAIPLVSIITPVYQAEAFLEETINSIIRQTFTDWELWLIDDHSDDGSRDILVKFAKKDPRINFIISSKNVGSGAARNLGIAKSRGQYLAFCDSDDIWLPTKLEKQLSAMKTGDHAICYTSYYRLSSSTKITVEVPKFIDFRMLLKTNFIACSTALVDTHRAGKVFMPTIRRRQDYSYWLSILSKGGSAIGIQEPLLLYRVRKNSLSRNKLLAGYYHWKVLRRYNNSSCSRILDFIMYVFYGLKKRSSLFQSS